MFKYNYNHPFEKKTKLYKQTEPAKKVAFPSAHQTTSLEQVHLIDIRILLISFQSHVCQLNTTLGGTYCLHLQGRHDINTFSVA
jgi:hypothetical protein